MPHFIWPEAFLKFLIDIFVIYSVPITSRVRQPEVETRIDQLHPQRVFSIAQDTSTAITQPMLINHHRSVRELLRDPRRGPILALEAYTYDGIAFIFPLNIICMFFI